MKDGKEKIGRGRRRRMHQNKVAPPYGKCNGNSTSILLGGLDVIESLVEYMLEEGYPAKNASGRVEIGDKEIHKSQIVEMYPGETISRNHCGFAGNRRPKSKKTTPPSQ